MILLDTTTRKLEVLRGGAKTTNELPFLACYVDIGQSANANPFQMVAMSANDGDTNGASAVTLVGSPGSNVTRQLKYLSIQNADTVPTTLTVRYNDNGTTYNIGVFVLQVNETLEFDAENGFGVITASGAIKLGPSAAGNVLSAGPTSPTAANSTSAFLMQGLSNALSFTFTPKTTGNLKVSIAGTVTNQTTATADAGVAIQGSYGTGSAPSVNAALTGTQAGAVQEFTNAVAPTAVGDVHIGFNIEFAVIGAAIGTPLWFDLAAKAITTVSLAPLVGVVITVWEV